MTVRIRLKLFLNLFLKSRQNRPARAIQKS